jgi:hypothetical protein
VPDEAFAGWVGPAEAPLTPDGWGRGCGPTGPRSHGSTAYRSRVRRPVSGSPGTRIALGSSDTRWRKPSHGGRSAPRPTMAWNVSPPESRRPWRSREGPDGGHMLARPRAGRPVRGARGLMYAAPRAEPVRGAHGSSPARPGRARGEEDLDRERRDARTAPRTRVPAAGEERDPRRAARRDRVRRSHRPGTTRVRRSRRRLRSSVHQPRAGRVRTGGDRCGRPPPHVRVRRPSARVPPHRPSPP